MPAPRPLAPAGVRSLAEDLRSRSDEELAVLLAARQDLARPTPSDLTALAARSTTRASTARAIDGLDRAALDVLTVCAVLDEPLTVDAVVTGLGGSADIAAAVAATMARLRDLALLWGSPTHPHVSRTVVDVLGPHPAGLGPTRAALGLGPAPTRPAEALPEPARVVVQSLLWGPPTAGVDSGSRSHEAALWLAAHGFCALEGDQLTLPRETALDLRGGRVLRDHTPDGPAFDGRSWPVETIDHTAGGSASEVLALVDDLLAKWSSDPPRVLKSGGLSVRDLASAARDLELTAEHTALLLEVSHAAGLLAREGDDEGHWAPTAAYDDWLDEPGGLRWARLALAWWSMTTDPSSVGAHRDGRVVAALSPAVQRPALRSLRHDIIAVIGRQPPGFAPTEASVVAALQWARPRRLPPDLPLVVAGILSEASALGMLALGAASSVGRVLAESDTRPPDELLALLAGAIDTHLPRPVTHLLLQADLTAVVPGPTSGGLTHFLRLAADLESRGGASVHRFSDASIRRCLDAGWSGDEILAALTDASSTPIPQPLAYLVQDTARLHGRLRVSAARSVLRVDDPTALDSLLVHRELGALQLRRIAPTVATSPVAPDILLDILRDSGQAAVAESASGAITLRESRIRRSTPPTTPEARVHPLDERAAYSLVRDLRKAEEATARAARTALPPLVPTGDPTTSLAILREACADRRGVWVGYSDAAGSVRRFLFHPDRIDHGHVSGVADGVRRTISIHRVTGVAAE